MTLHIRQAMLAALTGWAAPAAGADFQACIAEEARRKDYSGVVAVTEGGAPMTIVVRGETGAPGSGAITADTRFNIGSAGKMFTAVAVAQLVDAGKVAFDDPVGKYIPSLKPEARAVTLHQLLTHTSGLGDYFSPGSIGAVQAARRATDLLPLIAADQPQFAPGTQFRYSNSGFALLGMVVEAVSGQDYSAYMDEHIFKPAKMMSTSLEAGSPQTVAVGMTRLPPMTPGSGPVRMGPGPGPGGMPPADGPLRPAPGAAVRGSPSGGAFSTAADLQRFMAAFRAGQLTKSTAVLSAAKVDAGRGLSYAYGFGVTTAVGRAWFGHNGGTPGANAEVIASADGKWFIAALANRDPPLATEMLRYIQRVLETGSCS